jgi:hypothetical protein
MARDADAESLAASLGRDVMAGPWGAAASQASADRRAIQTSLAALTAEDRAALPDVMTTVDELVRRILSLVPTLHQLDLALPPNAMLVVDKRIAAAQAEPDSTARDRRIELLERQRRTLQELEGKRAVLARKCESATLALAQLRYESLRLRAGEITRALARAEDVARKAREVSADMAKLASDLERIDTDAPARLRKGSGGG